MNLQRKVVEWILEGPRDRSNLATFVGDKVAAELSGDSIWYCAKNQTTIARSHGRAKCAARVNKETDFHYAKRHGCGEYVLVKK